MYCVSHVLCCVHVLCISTEEFEYSRTDMQYMNINCPRLLIIRMKHLSIALVINDLKCVFLAPTFIYLGVAVVTRVSLLFRGRASVEPVFLSFYFFYSMIVLIELFRIYKLEIFLNYYFKIERYVLNPNPVVTWILLIFYGAFIKGAVACYKGNHKIVSRCHKE